MPIEIEERDDSACKWNADASGRRSKERKSTHQVAEQHEYRNGPDEGDVLWSGVAGILFKKIADAYAKRVGEEHLGDLLGATGLFDQQATTDTKCNQHSNQNTDKTTPTVHRTLQRR